MSTGSRNKSAPLKPINAAEESLERQLKQQAAEPIDTPPPLAAEAAPSLGGDVTVEEALARRDAETQKEIELGLRPADEVAAAPVSAGKTIPKVFAGPCPATPAHTKTRIYNTKGTIRYCCCDECGHTWKQSGPEAGVR